MGSFVPFALLLLLNTCTQAEPSTVEQDPVLFLLPQTAGIKYVFERENMLFG